MYKKKRTRTQTRCYKEAAQLSDARRTTQLLNNSMHDTIFVLLTFPQLLTGCLKRTCEPRRPSDVKCVSGAANLKCEMKCSKQTKSLLLFTHASCLSLMCPALSDHSANHSHERAVVKRVFARICRIGWALMEHLGCR